jgi:hypothetical protein
MQVVLLAEQGVGLSKTQVVRNKLKYTRREHRA